VGRGIGQKKTSGGGEEKMGRMEEKIVGKERSRLEKLKGIQNHRFQVCK